MSVNTRDTINESHSEIDSDFIWGAATAAYQIEGGAQSDGKGPSIWDDFAHRGKIKNRDTGDIACDHYHRMEADVDLMQSLGLQAYRFSISWPRILPDGTLAGGINRSGLDFYDRLTDRLLAAGIRPFATLYHWDMPLALERNGGWLNRDIAHHMADYAACCVSRLGDRVKDWIILNEPFVYCVLGYGIGYFPPGRIGLRKFLRASHHTLLAQGTTARAMRAANSNLILGTTISTVAGEPISQKRAHLRALRRHDAFFNRLYVDPVFGRGYPVQELPFLKKIERFAKPDDMEIIQYPFDFLGLNHYTRKIVRSARWLPWMGFRELKPHKAAEVTDMGWEVYPEGLYAILKEFAAYPEIPALFITENGAAFADTVSADGNVHDAARQRYLQEYIRMVLKAKSEGVPIKGYFVWSLLDNLEWREGYAKRFGIIHVDFASQKRTLKDSALWYRDFISKSRR